MSYLSFMPWSLQKRLLRYLLSQLDFLETDDLDLEDLGITWGQKSVVELKNIGLKTKKLSSILHLPNFVDFISARILYLKLTVPADILTSGIVVEISGVEIRLKVEPKTGQEHGFSRPEQRQPLAKSIKSNRPRITPPTVHDPGGSQTARHGPLEDPLFHPDLTAHHLAESFLQTESREDRLELQAAIASKSRYGQGSLSSSTISEEEVGLGTAEGYALPSFIASYLVGIADRLQLHVSDVAVHAEFVHSRESAGYQHTDITRSSRFMLRLSGLYVKGINQYQNDHGGSTAKRKIVLHQLSFLILPDPPSDSFDIESPEATSPLLRHSPPSPSCLAPAVTAPQLLRTELRHSETSDHIPDSSTDVDYGQKLELSTDLDQTELSADQSAAAPQPADIDRSIDDRAVFAATPDECGLSGNSGGGSHSSLEASSPKSENDVFHDASNDDHEAVSFSRSQETHSRRLSSPADLDNQVHAEALAKSGHTGSDKNDGIEIGQHVEDLTESKIFTHDEAQSMYMSAMNASKSSAGPTNLMPGAWGWSGESSHALGHYNSSSQAQSSANLTQKQNPTSSAGAGTPPVSQGHTNNKDSFEKDGPYDGSQSLAQMPQTAKQLITIDRVSAWLPATHESDLPVTPTREQTAKVDINSRDDEIDGHYNKHASVPDNVRRFGLDADEGQRPLALSGTPDDVEGAELSNHPRGAIAVEILNVHCQFDMQLGKTLIAIVKSIVGGSEEAPEGRTALGPPLPVPELSLKVSNIEIASLEHVPEFPISLAAARQSSCDDALLLSISFTGLFLSMSVTNGAFQQQLNVTKVFLSHSRSQFLSFSHDSKMRTSLRDTVFLQKNDVEISISSRGGTSKVEVHTKPIRLILELGQLDDILSRSGGLSSLLELGSSIASTSTVRTSPRRTADRRAELRGVRFENLSENESRSQDDFSFGLGKMNVRIGGVSIEVVGSECALSLSTSAVKIVHRTEGMGVQIDRTLVQGPFFLESSLAPDLSVTLQNIRMEYLPTPNDNDLDRLLAILTPSKDKYDADDDIMLDTLLRQRRKGGVLRLTVTSLIASLQGISHMAHLNKIGAELGRLSTVAKYLPEDDRPGILSLALVKTLEFEVNTGDPIGRLQLKAQALEGAHVNVPSLLAAQVGTGTIRRNDVETLLGEAVTYSDTSKVPPMIMCRFVADEMDPTVKLKLFNLCAEYHVMLITGLLKTADSFSAERSECGSEKSSRSFVPTSSPSSSEGAAEFVRRTNIAIAIRDSALALNPRDVGGRALFVLTDAIFSSPLDDSKDIKVSTEIRKASVMVIDRVNKEDPLLRSVRNDFSFRNEDQVQKLVQMGYVTVGYISSAKTLINISQNSEGEEKLVDVEFGSALFILESCADSTQTLISILNGLSLPSPPMKVSPYRTEIVPIEDLLASFSGDAFITEPGPDAGLRAEAGAESNSAILEQQDIEYVSEFYQPGPDDGDDISESGIYSEMLDSDVAESTESISVAPVSIKQSVIQASHHEGMSNSLLDFREEHFGRTSVVGGTAHRWDSTQNTYGLPSERNIRKSPLKVRIRDVHVIWKLFDGYDWQGTRDIISEAVKDIEARAAARRPRSSSKIAPSAEDEKESVIGDFLFNSIYIGIPANKDPRELANEINRDIDDLTSDTGSYATSTTVTGPSARHQPTTPRQKKLKLNRSKQHKMSFELTGVSADMLVFPSGSGEVQSSIDIRVKDLEIFDHLPTSTWKKFATYMRDAGEREADTSMIHIEILNVRPIPDLAASEMILKVTVLPLRLHVDQDALDFMSRFFEFKDQNAPVQSTPSTPPFLQRVEVNPVKIKLDFKPKRVDYGGLRSGRTTEFMNFFVLDQADMILRRVILYGVSGFDRLGIMLNNIWMPDVKRNQLPGILAGLAPIRSLVNVGSGVKDLVVVPMREYRKDGRIVRSIQKGALAFAKTTSKELIGLGAKLAIGTQTVLQNAETMLAPPSPGDPAHHPWQDLDITSDDDESRHQISPYADQPIGVVQGLRGAYASLERDLLLAKDAIIAVPGEAMTSGSAAGAAKAILKQAPTVILRPAIGASKAVGQTLLGAGNTLDRDNWRRVEEKYKRH